MNLFNFGGWGWSKFIEKTVKKTIEKMPIQSQPKFPCSDKDCLVKMVCNKACDKIEMDDGKLKDLFLKYNACPDCGSESFMEGPSGGAATNVKCNGCGHWFNLGLPLFIQRIHVGEGGRFYD